MLAYRHVSTYACVRLNHRIRRNTLWRIHGLRPRVERTKEKKESIR
jgi:hypothetical protein